VNQSDYRNSFIHSSFLSHLLRFSSFSFDASGFLRIKLISIRRRRKNQQQQQQQQQPQWWQLQSWLQQLLSPSSDHHPIRQCGFLALVVLVLVLILWLVPGRNWEVELSWHKHSTV
jgi:hypothetical protein